MDTVYGINYINTEQNGFMGAYSRTHTHARVHINIIYICICLYFTHARFCRDLFCFFFYPLKIVTSNQPIYIIICYVHEHRYKIIIIDILSIGKLQEGYSAIYQFSGPDLIAEQSIPFMLSRLIGRVRCITEEYYLADRDCFLRL